MDPNHAEVLHCQYECHVASLSPSINPNDVHDRSSGDQHFKITVIREKRYYQVPSTDLINSARTETTSRTFCIVSKNSIEQATNSILSTFDVPEDHRNFMATQILNCAKNMADNTHKNDKILNMLVIIEVHILYCNHINYDQTLEASMEDQHNVLGTASNTSIEGLERLDAGVLEEGLHNCVICLEDYKVDSEALQMPCSHFFHKSCTVNWLRRKNVCPICRFKISRSEN